MRELTIAVPATLRRPHRLVESTRSAYAGARLRPSGRLELRPRAGVARLLVSKAQLQRALRVLQAVLAEAERRGYEVAAYSGAYEPAGVAIVVRGHAYPLKMSELHDQVPLTDEDRRRWQRDNRWRLSWQPDLREPDTKLVANGRLKLSLPQGGRRSNWADGSRGALEPKLAGVFEELERRAAEDDRRADERAREREAWLLAEEQRRERQLRERLEEARVERLRERARKWREAADVRQFVGAVRERSGGLAAEDRAALDEWCAWAEEWADRLDPLHAVETVAAPPEPTLWTHGARLEAR